MKTEVTRDFQLLMSLLGHLLLLCCVPGFCSSPRQHIGEGYLELFSIYLFTALHLSPGNRNNMRKLLRPLAFCLPRRLKLNAFIYF